MHQRPPAAGWDLTVPEDDAELRRHGVRPGQRLPVVATPPEPVLATGEASRQPRKNRRLSFAGSIQAEPDLSEKTGEYLTGFGRSDLVDTNVLVAVATSRDTQHEDLGDGRR